MSRAATAQWQRSDSAATVATSAARQNNSFSEACSVCKQKVNNNKKKNAILRHWKNKHKSSNNSSSSCCSCNGAAATATLADIVAQFDYFLDPSLSFTELLQAASFYLHVSLLYDVEHFYLLLLYAVARARGTLTTAQSCPLAVAHSVHWVAVQQQ